MKVKEYITTGTITAAVGYGIAFLAGRGVDMCWAAAAVSAGLCLTIERCAKADNAPSGPDGGGF